MKELRLKIINLHAPYMVMQDPEKHNNFYFVSDSGTRFDVDFTNNDSIIPSGAIESKRFVTGCLFDGLIVTNIVIFIISRLPKERWMGK